MIHKQRVEGPALGGPKDINRVFLFGPDQMGVGGDVSVWWNKSGYYEDSLGHRFTFTREDGKLDLMLGGGEDVYATAGLRVYEPENERFKSVQDDAGLGGMIVRAAQIQKMCWFRDKKIPKPEHRGRWVLPAYIAYFRHQGAEAMMQEPADELQDYHRILGFKPVTEVPNAPNPPHQHYWILPLKNPQ